MMLLFINLFLLH